MRTRTPVQETVKPDGTTSRRFRVQRVCNGCGEEVGDANRDEIDRSIAGLPLPDVRHECAWCAPFLAEVKQ